MVGVPARKTNRDAIGARVQIDIVTPEGKKTLSQTITAGDSYLSQSSKWLTFGLGQATGIKRARIRWPGSNQFVEVNLPDIDCRYRVSQETGKATRVGSPRAVRLVASEPAVPKASGASRLRFSLPPLVKSVEYQNSRLKTVRREAPFKGPLLVTLWSSTCPICLAELTDLGSQQDDLKSQGVELLALNVDGLGEQAAPTSQALQAILARRGYSGEFGLATDELVSQLDELQQRTVYRKRPLPVPASFLFDHGGWLRVVYRGAVSTKQLTQDVNHLRVDEAEGLALSLPFPGRWARDRFVTNPLAVAGVYLEEGHYDAARSHLQKYIEENPAPIEKGNDAEARMARRRLADVHYQLSVVLRRQRKPNDSLRQLELALRLSPTYLPGLIDMADAMTQRGDLSTADLLLSRAIKVAPSDPRVHVRTGLLRMRQSRAAEAIPHLEQALRSDHWLSAANNLAWIRATHPDDKLRDGTAAIRLARRVCDHYKNARPSTLDTLAAAFAAAKEFEEAKKWAEKAVRLAKANGQKKLAERIAERARRYSNGKSYIDASLAN